MTGSRRLPHDWYPGEVPANVSVDPSAYLGTSALFVDYRSTAPVGLRMEAGSSLCDDTTLDVGPDGCISLGRYAVVSGGVRVICDARIEIGDHSLVAWEAVLMDSYRVPREIDRRRRALERIVQSEAAPASSSADAQPLRIGPNAWIGFRACVLPGVTVGEGSIVAAGAVVRNDVPPYSIAAGNPARIVRSLAAPGVKKER